MMVIIFSSFSTLSNRDLLMYSGPYTYRNKPLILQNQTIDFEFNPDCLDKIPLWVKFPSLHFGYWLVDFLSKLASVVGRMMYTDKFMVALEHISYARVLLEVNIVHTL